MRSQGPRVFRLSESVPPSDFDAVSEELNSSAPKKEREPLKILGSVKEKGFSIQPVPFDRISVPRPRATSFPIARHRSDGPHWGPPSIVSSPATHLHIEGEESASVFAEPLGRRKDAPSQSSVWRSNRKSERGVSVQTQNVFDDTREVANALETSAIIEKGDDDQRQSPGVVEPVIEAEEVQVKGKSSRRGQIINEVTEPTKVEKESRPEDAPLSDPKSIAEISQDNGLMQDLKSHTRNALPTPKRLASLEERGGLGEEDVGPAIQATQSGLNAFTDREQIDAETRNAVFAMSSQELADAQAELFQKMRPDILELLRRRGAEKEKKRLAEKAGAVSKLCEGFSNSGNEKESVEVATSLPAGLPPTKVSVVCEDNLSKIGRGVDTISVPGAQTASERVESVRGTTIGPADLLAIAPVAQQEKPSIVKVEENPPPPTSDPWTLRVEAVRSMRFDLDATVVSLGPASQSNSQPSSASMEIAEGDPVGSGYLLKETLALVRSTVAGQRAVALRLIAAVLDKSVHNLQNQNGDNSSLHSECIKGSIDWQAIWAYALGPEAELVLTLRLALDDGHSTVVAACARAIQSLLSYSANEMYFDSLEAIWPGDTVVYTAPIFRKKTNQNEGFIGGGCWKYNVKSREMFPFSSTSTQEKVEEDGNDTVADDGHISNKDVAAGLIRMGLLPRIRYLLEVDKLIAAEEALLNVLICMARHSPTAANAVMKCPRLIDAILQRFIGSNGEVSNESWSARLKAIRLLKVLSQAKRSNCVYFEESGALQTLMRPLLKQGCCVNQPQHHAQDLAQGFYEITIETVRFWRVCIDYGIGISYYSDCYSALCFWLLPMSKEEVLTAGNNESLQFAKEIYSLLEHLARSLPVLHAKLEYPAVAKQSGLPNWSWGVATAMLNTAMKWLSTECISGIHLRLEQSLDAYNMQCQEALVLKSSTRSLLGIVAAVIHFLATVCEKIVSEQVQHHALDDPNNCSLSWLPTFVPNVGLTLVKSGLLNFSCVAKQSEFPVPPVEMKRSFLECLFFCNKHSDNDSVLVSVNCLNALIRLSGIVDKLISIAKPKSVVPPVDDQTVADKVLHNGLLLCADNELRTLLVLCEENVISRSHILQMSVRGGPAPGLGIGWGSFRGGAWSKEAIIAQASARLAMDLISVLSMNLLSNHFLSEGETVRTEQGLSEEFRGECRLLVDPLWRVNFGLAVVATSTTMSRDIAHRVSSSVIFHPSILSALIQKIEEALESWRSKTSHDDGLQSEGGVAEDQNFDPEYLSKILLQHTEKFWLAVKKRKCQDEWGYNGISTRNIRGLGTKLATVDEESSVDNVSCVESLMREWVGQRLPLPSHWMLSPLAIGISQASKKDWENSLDIKSKQTEQLEEVIKAGLTFFLGFELLGAYTPEAELISAAVPLVRKIHSLSTVFISGGDIFLHPLARDLIGALQGLIGDQVGALTNFSEQNTEGNTSSEHISRGPQNESSIEQNDSIINALQHNTTPGDLEASESIKEHQILDFEGSIDASYLNYSEIIAEQFVATSYGDFVFGRQVALQLWLNVPHMIRLATWRVLTDARVLELLPPLSRCCGPCQLYLYPFDDNQQMLESFVSAWSSGALDKAAKRDSLPFTLALHHLGGYLFGTNDSEEILLLKKKTLRTLIRSSVQKLDRQKMLSRLVRYVSAWPFFPVDQTNAQSEAKSREQIQQRLLFLLEASEGDASLITGVQRVRNLCVCKA